MHMLYRIYLVPSSQLCEVVTIGNPHFADEETEA